MDEKNLPLISPALAFGPMEPYDLYQTAQYMPEGHEGKDALSEFASDLAELRALPTVEHPMGDDEGSPLEGVADGIAESLRKLYQTLEDLDKDLGGETE